MAKEKVFTPKTVAVEKLVAVWQQAGTGNPVITVLQNTLPNQPTAQIHMTRIGTGTYTVDFPNNLELYDYTAFAAPKDPSFQMVIYRSGPKTLTIESFPSSDNWDSQTCFEYTHYNQINMNK